MSTPKEYFEQLLDRLQTECLFGQVHYRMWRFLNSSFDKEPDLAKLSLFFFKSSGEAHLDSATLHLNRLIDRRRDALDVSTLIRFAKKHPSIFENANPSQIEEQVEKDLEWLTDNETPLERFRQQRNNHFIHLSKEYFSNPSRDVYADYPTTYLELYDTLCKIGELLNRYSFYLNDSTLHMEMMEEQPAHKSLLYYLRLALEQSKL